MQNYLLDVWEKHPPQVSEIDVRIFNGGNRVTRWELTIKTMVYVNYISKKKKMENGGSKDRVRKLEIWRVESKQAEGSIKCGGRKKSSIKEKHTSPWEI